MIVGPPSSGKTTLAKSLVNNLSGYFDKNVHIPIINTDRYILNVLKQLYKYDLNFIREIEIEENNERNIFEVINENNEPIFIDDLNDSLIKLRLDNLKKGFATKSIVSYGCKHKLCIIDNVSDTSEFKFYEKNSFCPIYMDTSIDDIKKRKLSTFSKVVYIKDDDDYIKLEKYFSENIKHKCKYFVEANTNDDYDLIASKIIKENLFKKHH